MIGENYNWGLINEINEAITEELGISDKVIELSENIYNEIVKAFNSEQSTIIENGVGRKYGWITYPLDENIILNISYDIINFADKQYMEEYAKKKGLNTDARSFISYEKKLSGKYKYVTNAIYLYGIAISGSIDKPSLKDSIQHEIEHIFQQYKMGKGFEDDDIVSIINTSFSKGNEYAKSVANIVYMSIKYEQKGFANGLYAYCKDDPVHYRERFLSSPAYEKLDQLKKDKEFIEKNLTNSDLLKEIDKYSSIGLTKENIIQFTDKIISQCVRRFSRVFCKVIKDINNQMKSGKITKMF